MSNSDPTWSRELTGSIEVTLPLKFKRPSGYAFIAFKTEEQAQNALEKLKEEGECSGYCVREVSS